MSAAEPRLKYKEVRVDLEIRLKTTAVVGVYSPESERTAADIAFARGVASQFTDTLLAPAHRLADEDCREDDSRILLDGMDLTVRLAAADA